MVTELSGTNDVAGSEMEAETGTDSGTDDWDDIGSSVIRKSSSLTTDAKGRSSLHFSAVDTLSGSDSSNAREPALLTGPLSFCLSFRCQLSHHHQRHWWPQFLCINGVYLPRSGRGCWSSSWSEAAEVPPGSENWEAWGTAPVRIAELSLALFQNCCSGLWPCGPQFSHV